MGGLLDYRYHRITGSDLGELSDRWLVKTWLIYRPPSRVVVIHGHPLPSSFSVVVLWQCTRFVLGKG